MLDSGAGTSGTDEGVAGSLISNIHLGHNLQYWHFTHCDLVSEFYPTDKSSALCFKGFFFLCCLQIYRCDWVTWITF